MSHDTSREAVFRTLIEAGWEERSARDLGSSAHVIIYEKGSMIFHAGEPADLLYVLVSGQAKLYYSRADGERILADIVPARHLLGFLPPGETGDGEPVQRFSAEALSRCTVALVTRSRVNAAAQTLSTAELSRLAGRLTDEWARISERALNYLMLDVRGRLLLAIANLAERFGIPDGRGTLLPLRLSHEDFGELIGASRPMISRHLKQLADARVFFKSGGRYILARPEEARRAEEPRRAAVHAERPELARDWRSPRRLPSVVERRQAMGGLREVAR